MATTAMRFQHMGMVTPHEEAVVVVRVLYPVYVQMTNPSITRRLVGVQHQVEDLIDVAVLRLTERRLPHILGRVCSR